MLFLAVTLGFLVENLREHKIENQREKEYIRAMIEDLKQDTASFHSVINSNLMSAAQIDSLIHWLKKKPEDIPLKRVYYLARLIPLTDADLTCQDKTFKQLTGSGGLRLIHNTTSQNKIGDYYLNGIGLSQMQYQNRRDLFESYHLLFDAGVFQDIIKSRTDTSVHIADNRFILLSNDPVVINNICTRFHIMYSYRKVVSVMANRYINQATDLIVYLQDKYHMKEE